MSEPLSDLGNITIPDYAESLALHRVWTVGPARVLKHPARDFYNYLNLYSLNGAIWTPEEPLKAACNNLSEYHIPPEASCTCGIYGRTEFPKQVWEGIIIELIYDFCRRRFGQVELRGTKQKWPLDPRHRWNVTLKEVGGCFIIKAEELFKDINWPVFGEMLLWGKLRKGTGADNHPQGYRGEYAKPKKLVIPSFITHTFDAKPWSYHNTDPYGRDSHHVNIYLMDASLIARVLSYVYKCEVICDSEDAFFVGGLYNGQKVPSSLKNNKIIALPDGQALIYQLKRQVPVKSKIVYRGTGGEPLMVPEDYEVYYPTRIPNLFVHTSLKDHGCWR